MKKELRIRHTTNAGVLINIGRKSLGVDLFSRDSKGLYPDTPMELKEELLDEIEKGHIEAILFTHGHGDHFCLEDVIEALKRNPDLMVISTDEVIGRIQMAAPPGKRLFAISPEEKDNVRLQFSNGSLELFNSRHMGEQYAGVQNIVCMLEVDGMRIVLPGDAWPSTELFERIAAWSFDVDLLAGPFPLIGIPSNRRMIEKCLRVKTILAMHLPRRSQDVQNWIVNTKRICENAKDGLPMPVFGEVLGQEYVF